MRDPAPDDDDDAAHRPRAAAQYADLSVTEEAAGQRLDKALALLAAGLPGLSRSRIAEALAEGRITGPDGAPAGRGTKARAGETWRIALPALAEPVPAAEAIPLAVAYEDAHLIVVDKPAGMVVHPAPGSETGTLVNALLHHCGGSLAGIGGERRPGIVHRIDKDTSGLVVAAKTEAALAGLAALFAAHDVEREYRAVLWGAPDAADARLMGLDAVSAEPGGWLRIDAAVARHPTDRKRMAVARADRPGARRAVTRLRVLERYGAPALACLAAFRLETGRTHQIRVHASHVGHPLIGDATYGRARSLSPAAADARTRSAIAGFPRQALHAAVLGFVHPVTARKIALESPLPDDLNGLLKELRRNPGAVR